MRKFITTAAAASMAIAGLAAAVPSFAAQTGSGVGSIVNCDATGSRQGKGAVIGALAGAVIGNNVSNSKSAPVVGALTGAAAGSYIGCQQQRVREASRGSGQYVATARVNVRSRPSTSGARIGQLYPGEAVKVGNYVGNWAWVEPSDGSRAGYVSANYLARR